MLLKVAAIVLLCSCLGHCCYPDAMYGRFEWNNISFTFAVDYVAGITVQLQEYNKAYRVFFAEQNLHFTYKPGGGCHPFRNTAFYQDIPAAIPDDAQVVQKTNDTITYFYSIYGRNDTVTVSNKNPCFPLTAEYTYETHPGRYHARFFQIKAGASNLIKKFLQDCKTLQESFQDLFG